MKSLAVFVRIASDWRVFASSGHVRFGDYFCACSDENVKSDVCKCNSRRHQTHCNSLVCRKETNTSQETLGVGRF